MGRAAFVQERLVSRRLVVVMLALAAAACASDDVGLVTAAIHVPGHNGGPGGGEPPNARVTEDLGFVGGAPRAAAGNPLAHQLRVVVEGDNLIGAFPVVP